MRSGASIDPLIYSVESVVAEEILVGLKEDGAGSSSSTWNCFK